MNDQPTPEQIDEAAMLSDGESPGIWLVRAIVAVAVCAFGALAPWGCSGGMTLP